MPGCCSCCKVLCPSHEDHNAQIRKRLGCCAFIVCTWCQSLSWLVVLPTWTLLLDNTYDLMYIDNTHDDWYTGPAREAVAETEQFKAWSKSMKDSYEDCKKEHSAEECFNGFDVRIAVFNVTNAVQIVQGVELPHVQELPAISLKMYPDKKDIDIKHWDSTGVAKYRVETTYELDDEKCFQACRDLLEEDIIVPNPVWAQLNAMNAEMALAVLVLMASLPSRGMSPSAAFDLREQEAAALGQILLEKDSQKRLGLVGLFLQTALAAVTKLKTGDPSGTCLLGALSLDAMRCGSILQKLVEGVQASWGPTMQIFGQMYGTGAAAPIFIKRKVKQVLGFKGASFSDPLTQLDGLSFAAAHDNKPPQSDPPEEYRYAQMSQDFGKEGIFYNIKYRDAEYDCRYDKDCTMTSSKIDSCTPSEICTPTPLSGYLSTNFPGHVWNDERYGSAKGFTDLEVNKTFRGFKNGRTVEFTVLRETYVHVPSKRDQTVFQQYSPDGNLHFYELIVSDFGARLENCDGNVSLGSPGYDCNSPLYTVNLAPSLLGVPLYISNPYFDNRLLKTDMFKERHLKALKTAAYNPVSRVAISRCKGTDWCDDHRYGKHNTTLWVEKHLGYTFRVQSSLQMNVRIGITASQLYPQVEDALIPVYWSSESLVPAEHVRERLFDLQDAPVQLHWWFHLLVIPGSWYIIYGSICCYAGKKVEAEYQAKKLLRNNGS